MRCDKEVLLVGIKDLQEQVNAIFDLTQPLPSPPKIPHDEYYVLLIQLTLG
jgi:hypothetical protein